MAQAPRFQAFFSRVEDRQVLTMPRRTWEQFKVREGSPVEIALEQTPLRGVAREATVVAARATRSSTASAEIEIVRYDPNDAPTPYNLDRYVVWEHMPSHQSFDRIIGGGATRDDTILRDYLDENVFLVKQDPGDDHWSSDPPSSAMTIFRST